jgi:uncharacterized protein YjeT (DUF2065 family)
MIMSTPIAYGSHAVPIEAARTQPGLFRRIFRTLMEAREAQALRYVSGYLNQLSDEQLRTFGMKDAEIRAVRSRRGEPASYWI